MGYFSGTNGHLEVDGVRVGRVVNWQSGTTAAALDVTSLGDTDSVVTTGLRKTSGTCVLYYHQETTGSNSGNAASQLINKVIKAGAGGEEPGQALKPDPVTFKLVVEDGSPGGKRISVDALITNATLGMSVGAIFASSLTFEAIGAPTEVTL